MKFVLNITGGAYFRVQRPDGLFVYTLGRQFELDETGMIITAEQGYKLINETHVPAPYNEPLRIDEHGEITVFHGGVWLTIGFVMVVGFEHPELLDNLGDGYYGETIGSGVALTGTAGTPPFEGITIYYIPEGGKKQRPIAALNKPAAITGFIAKMRTIALNITNHPELYLSPMPSIATFTANIDALEDAEAVASTHVTGSAAKRNQKYDLVLDNVHNLQLYIQVLADNADDTDDAITIITNSGFDLKERGVYVKDALKATHGKLSGTVKLTAKAIEDAGAYEWQISDDNLNWTPLPTTIDATTKATGLTPATTVYFRCRPVMTDGIGDWTQAVSIIVI